MILLTTLSFTGIISMVTSYPDYIPNLACDHMFPIAHGVDAMNARTETMTPPYMITVNATSYKAGDVIEIFLNSSHPSDGRYAFYEGVFVEARRSDCQHPSYSEPVGTFFFQENEDFLQTMECSNIPKSAVRHMKHEHVFNNTFYWKAPSTSVGHVYFRGTIARKQTKFWTNVNSKYVKDVKSSSVLPNSYCAPRTDYIGCPKCPSSNAEKIGTFSIPHIIALMILVCVMIRGHDSL